MNINKVLIWTSIIAFSFFAGVIVEDYRRAKDYEAACLFKDIINSAIDMDDDFGREVQNHYDEWVMDFEALEFKHLKEEDLDNYYWCY